MFMSEYGVYVFLALLIILVLAIIAGRLLWRLRLQNRQQRSETVEIQENQQVQSLEARQGIRVLSRSYLAGQLGGSEFVLRVAVLAETAKLEQEGAEDKALFVGLALSMAHIPTHHDWQALGREDKAKYTTEMALFEGSYREQLQLAAQRLAS
ncbi:MAG: hypothetical protein ACI9BO_002055 [Zhongshania sp.]|jgi:hypothetical protein